tara:strand:+ start:59 stop:502 length:444 start_codon:yes stop_codon:yes gene_type:complete
MKINYSQILKNNMINVFKDVLKIIDKEGLTEGHHLFITFKTNYPNVKIPSWIKDKFPNEMTIVMQYEYWNFRITKNYFKITLSFNDIKSDLSIPYDSVISFADPYANFGLKLNSLEKSKKEKIKKKTTILKTKNNIVDLNKFRKKLN